MLLHEFFACWALPNPLQFRELANSPGANERWKCLPPLSLAGPSTATLITQSVIPAIQLEPVPFHETGRDSCQSMISLLPTRGCTPIQTLCPEASRMHLKTPPHNMTLCSLYTSQHGII